MGSVQTLPPYKGTCLVSASMQVVSDVISKPICSPSVNRSRSEYVPRRKSFPKSPNPSSLARNYEPLPGAATQLATLSPPIETAKLKGKTPIYVSCQLSERNSYVELGPGRSAHSWRKGEDAGAQWPGLLPDFLLKTQQLKCFSGRIASIPALLVFWLADSDSDSGNECKMRNSKWRTFPRKKTRFS